MALAKRGGMADDRVVRSVAELADAAQEASDKLGAQRLWWRGQARASWGLIASVHREDRGDAYERNVASLFQLGASTRCDKCPRGDDYPGWLFLMQHHGLPTRLLDWTESPMAAAYFAVWETRHARQDAAIWVLSPFTLNGKRVGRGSIVDPANEPARTLFAYPFDARAKPSNETLAIKTREIDLRMTVQLSAFTIHGGPTSLHELDKAGEFLLKFTVPAHSKTELIEDLRRMGVREASLFPDLDHLAADIKRYRWPTKAAAK